MSEGAAAPPPGKRPQFGTRFLKNKNNVFEHNAWDNVVWDDNQEAEARAKVQENSEVTLSSEEIEKLEQQAATQWDGFYDIHQNRFFKDRNWLFTEFPELAPHLAHTFPLKQGSDDTASAQHTPTHHNLKTAASEARELSKNEEHENTLDTTGKDMGTLPSSLQSRPAGPMATTSVRNTDLNASEGTEELLDSCSTEDSLPNDTYPGEDATYRILEVGCGVGNTVFPILKTNNDEGLFVYGCDFSSTAVDIVKESPDYERRRCHAFVCDISSEEWEAPFPYGSLDIIVCIFVLSALHPDKYPHVVKKMAQYLRPGGMILYRDYGRYDMAQLRFKKGRCLADNFYMRGDGTRCYFITQEEVRELMTGAGLEEVQNLVDRRLQVNRGKQLTMYRVWVQAKYRKPV